MATRAIGSNSEISSPTVSCWKSSTIAVVLALAIAGYFWVDSRYPALLKKYHAGSQVKAVGALTFDAVYHVDRTMPLAQRVWGTTLNWLNANRIGMTFGFFFGAAALTLLATFPKRRTANPYLNTLLGAFAGMPLGVCANCVVPIGRGLYASGMATESVLAAMFSSPALNVVVLAMVFALFPLPVAILKVATTLALIFLVAPLIGKRLVQAPGDVACPVQVGACATWKQALVSTLKSYAQSFWYVFRVGAPLMLLAAVLGALAIETIPQTALTAPVTVIGIVLVALVSTFLPVPMAFDAVIAYIAMSRGVPLPYVVAILCTLGIYSVYSLVVLGKTISWKVAVTSSLAVAVLGAGAGFVAIGLR